MLVLAVFVALLALLPCLGQPAHADTGDDSLLVYCLSPAHRTGLLEAAAALGLAHRDNAGSYVLPDNTPLDPALWSAEHRDDFARTCKALFAAQRTPEPGLTASLLPFLTALAGAVLAFLAASWRDRVARGHALADSLRSAFNGYSQAVEAYLDGSRINRTNTQVVERRYGLMLELAKAKAAYRKWPMVADVEAEVEGRQLGRPGQEDPDAGEIREWLKKTRGAVFRIAHALAHPLLRNRAMRGTSAGDT
jgi:hypothetical protein